MMGSESAKTNYTLKVQIVLQEHLYSLVQGKYLGLAMRSGNYCQFVRWEWTFPEKSKLLKQGFLRFALHLMMIIDIIVDTESSIANLYIQIKVNLTRIKILIRACKIRRWDKTSHRPFSEETLKLSGNSNLPIKDTSNPTRLSITEILQ